MVFFHLQPALFRFLECPRLKPHQEFNLRPGCSETTPRKSQPPPACSRKSGSCDKRERGAVSLAQFQGMLVASLARCGHVHVVTQSSQKLRPQLPTSSQPNLSVPLSPVPTITTEKSRPLQTRLFPGRGYLAPRPQCHQQTMHETCKTFLPGSAESPGMGQGKLLIPGPRFWFCWQKPNDPLGLVCDTSALSSGVFCIQPATVQEEPCRH